MLFVLAVSVTMFSFFRRSVIVSMLEAHSIHACFCVSGGL